MIEADLDKLLQEPHAYTLQRDFLQCVGPDAGDFLQGQLSQDIEGLSNFSSAWSFLLNPNGKLCTWLRITRLSSEEYMLDTEQGFGQAALERLNRFKIRMNCDIRNTQSQIVRILGIGSREAKGESHKQRIVADVGWQNLEGFDLLGPDIAKPDRCREGNENDYEYIRVFHGVPKMGLELTEGVIPAETNLVPRGVSFTKGCYTGQELVARLDRRGNNVAKHLRKISSSGTCVVGSEITVEGKKVGVVTSAVPSGDGSIGLGYVSRSLEIPGIAEIDGFSASITSASD